MSVYLHDIPLEIAQERFYEALSAIHMDGILGVEAVPLDENVVGRVLAEPVWARLSSPHYHAAAMDGFAVKALNTAGALPSAPVRLSCSRSGEDIQAVYIDTGDPLPSWANAVIPIENVEPIDESSHPSANPRKPSAIRVRASVTPWSHVRPMGEDMVATQLVLPAGQTMRPVDLGAVAASGHSQVTVARRPRVAILPTGTELVPLGQPVQPGDIIEFNSMVLAAQINAWGGQASRMPISPDDFETLSQQVLQAAREHDLVLVNAGSSAGSEDYTARIVESQGVLLVHGVAVRPGHPVILGLIKVEQEGMTKQVPVIGVPGYPVSAALTGEIFVEPLISQWLGRRPAEPVEIQAILTRKVTSPAGDDDYLRVTAGRVGDRLLAAPLSRGAGVISSLVRADGIVILPRGTQGLPAGASVTVRLYRTPAEIERTIFVIGSHDLTLDLMAQYLAVHGVRLSSANVGSQAGLVALHRDEAHLAGSHLLDPDNGTYNVSFLPKYLPGVPARVIALVGRQQGLLVAKGNPRHITSLEDLIRKDVTYVNRQRGAGTRVLLDYQLDLKGIAPADIQGYNQEEFTHLAVAASVASGRSDCGLGISAAAQALELDFVPLFQERYDLIIPTRYADSPLLEPLFALLEDEQFRRDVAGLPGYDISVMGQLIAEYDGTE
jgi:putative molybdopterin biosynthesis protein